MANSCSESDKEFGRPCSIFDSLDDGTPPSQRQINHLLAHLEADGVVQRMGVEQGPDGRLHPLYRFVKVLSDEQADLLFPERHNAAGRGKLN